MNSNTTWKLSSANADTFVMGPNLAKAVDRLVQKQRVRDSNWRRLEVAARKTTNNELRPLVEAYFDQDIVWAESARQKARSMLVARGLDPELPAPCPQKLLRCVESVPQVAATRALRSRVDTIDRYFEQLLSRVGGTGRSLTVAVLDDGFDTTHPSLVKKLWRNPKERRNGLDDDNNGWVDDIVGFNFAKKSARLANNTSSHGTHVMGIATAGTKRLRGLAAVAFSSSSSTKSIRQSVDYAIAQGARVINLSFRAVEHAEGIIQAIAKHPEVLFVKSAGNINVDLSTEAARKNDSVSRLHAANLAVVASANAQGQLWTHSNYGAKHATVAARGANVVSTISDGKFGEKSGTSMAAPAIANLAGKCMLLCETLTAAEVHTLIQRCSTANPAWEKLVAAGGISDARWTMTVAAMIGLLRSGLSETQATKQLSMSASAGRRAYEIAREYVPSLNFAHPAMGAAA